MAYKANFRPLEGLIDGVWRVLDPAGVDLATVGAASQGKRGPLRP
jgi:arginine-tRNA-protein transferase